MEWAVTMNEGAHAVLTLMLTPTRRDDEARDEEEGIKVSRIAGVEWIFWWWADVAGIHPDSRSAPGQVRWRESCRALEGCATPVGSVQSGP